MMLPDDNMAAQPLGFANQNTALFDLCGAIMKFDLSADDASLIHPTDLSNPMSVPNHSRKIEQTESPPKAESLSAKDKLKSHLKAEFDEIVDRARTFKLEGQSGPTLKVKTRVEWSDLDGRALYFAVREQLHDRRRVGGYFYVTKLKPDLKVGFRILVNTQHSSPRRAYSLAVRRMNTPWKKQRTLPE